MQRFSLQDFTRFSATKIIIVLLAFVLGGACATEQKEGHKKEQNNANNSENNSGGASLKAQATTFVIVRHAEKMIRPNDDNPELTAAGRRRAEKFAELFGETGVAALFSTPYKRCEQTAEPLSKALQLPINFYEAGKSTAFVDSLAREGSFAGKTVFIVGHSNTVPQMLNALVGGENYRQIDDNDYDNAFILTRSANGAANCARLRLSIP